MQEAEQLDFHLCVFLVLVCVLWFVCFFFNFYLISLDG